MSYPHKYFPKQTVSDAEKLSYDYGLRVAKAIESEWFSSSTSRSSRYRSRYSSFHNLRLYARGEQSIQKYKDELSINGDLSYLNLDWKPVPIISKFVDIVVNGMSDKDYELKAVSQDPYGVSKRTQYMESLLRDMLSKDFNEKASKLFGIDMFENDLSKIPADQDELKIHMQLNYKQNIEVAQEQAINVLFDASNYDLIKKRFYYDLAVLGIGATKTSFNTSEGAIVEYVDPADLVYSYSESPNFDDLYYVGEVKSIPINELAKQFPFLTEQDLEEISNTTYNYDYEPYSSKDNDINKVKILYFNYKTYMNEVYKIKETKSGGARAIEKDDTFNPPDSAEGDYSKLQRSIEVLYDGALILGTNKLLRWEMCENMMRPKSDFNKVKMNYQIVAPRIYNGRIESLVGRITGFADMIQLTHLKLQQVMSRMVPDGVYLDADGLAEVDLGNGTNYNPQEALNMFFQTGSVIGRSFTQDGDINPGKVPIQEITSGSGGNKMQALIANYNYYLQMIRDVTGLNEARDGSSPDKNALVGLQKLAAANSNTATRHVLQAGMFLTLEAAECLSMRVSDIIEYSPTADAFMKSIGAHNFASLEEVKDLHIHDFGIFLELAPDEEEKAMLENNIQMALAQKNIDLEDAIDIRQVKSVSLANQLLKIRRKKKLAQDALQVQQNIANQTQANNNSAQVAANLDVRKNQAAVQSEIALEQAKAQIRAAAQEREAELKKELMELEFNYNIQLKGVEVEGLKSREKEKEDRKDERTKIQASQQSELIDQRKTGGTPKKFESAGNDILGGGFNLGSFDPK